MAKWPRLTETLTEHPVRCDTCQNCGGTWTRSNRILRWQECDDRYNREYRMLSLCQRCSAMIIEKHPRLYAQLEDMEVWPGGMSVCIGCKHRDGNSCSYTSKPLEDLKFTPQPKTAHIRAADRRLSRWITMVDSKVTWCSGKETDDGE